MAHPKRKTSKTRRDKRRTHYKASEQTRLEIDWPQLTIKCEDTRAQTDRQTDGQTDK